MNTSTLHPMTSAPKTGETTWLWLFKIVSGAIIILILVVHFIVNHMIGQNGLLTYQDVINYYNNPLIPIMEIVFLAFVVPHALVGLRSILLDLRPSRSVLQAINWLFTIIGIIAIGWGAWLIGAIAAK